MADTTEPHVEDTTQAALIAQVNRELEDAGIDVEDYAWGGDGSNLHQPVRAHVEAVFIPTNERYPPEFEPLLQRGDPRQQDDDNQTFLESLGLTQEHVPELLRMVRDRRLNIASSESDEVWAPVHALTAIAEFDIHEHINALIPLFDVDDEWNGEEAPILISTIGDAALEPLQRYLQDRTRWIYGRGRASSAIEEIGKRSPESRTRAIQILSEELEHSHENDPTLNGLLLSSLLNLDAVAALPTIRHAFEQNTIDETIVGDWATVLEELGQEPEPNDPLITQSRAHAKITHRQKFPWMEALPVLPVTASSAPSKKKSSSQKNKRKMASASRKANRKKK